MEILSKKGILALSCGAMKLGCDVLKSVIDQEKMAMGSLATRKLRKKMLKNY